MDDNAKKLERITNSSVIHVTERINIEKMIPLLSYFEFNKNYFRLAKTQKYNDTIAFTVYGKDNLVMYQKYYVRQEKLRGDYNIAEITLFYLVIFR